MHTCDALQVKARHVPCTDTVVVPTDAGEKATIDAFATKMAEVKEINENPLDQELKYLRADSTVAKKYAFLHASNRMYPYYRSKALQAGFDAQEMARKVTATITKGGFFADKRHQPVPM